MILSDSGKFEIDESSDLGTKTTVGTWTIFKDTITLKPTKLYLEDRRDPKKPKREYPPNISEILITVDDQKKLKIISPKNSDMAHLDKPLTKMN
jgi:hypothetical protein